MNTTSKNEIKMLQNILKYVYSFVPIVAGTDKFLNLLTNWDDYLLPTLTSNFPLSPTTIMMIIGIIEIIAGIIVLTKTQLGAYIVVVWLLVIAFNLILTGDYYDVAVRDIVIAFGAFTLARLTSIVDE